MRGMWLTPDGSTLYAACMYSSLLRYSLTSAGTVASIYSYPNPVYSSCEAQSVLFDQSSGNLYVACSIGGVQVVSPQGGVTTVASSSQCAYGSTLIRDSVSGTIYAGCFNSVISIANKTNAVNILMTSPQCPGSQKIAYDAPTSSLYLTCHAQTTATAASSFRLTMPANGGMPTAVTQVTSAGLCLNPGGVAILPLTGQVLLSCSDRLIESCASICAVNSSPTLSSLACGSTPVQASTSVVSSWWGFDWRCQCAVFPPESRWARQLLCNL